MSGHKRQGWNCICSSQAQAIILHTLTSVLRSQQRVWVIGFLLSWAHRLGPINSIINSQGFTSKQHLGSLTLSFCSLGSERGSEWVYWDFPGQPQGRSRDSGSAGKPQAQGEVAKKDHLRGGCEGFWEWRLWRGGEEMWKALRFWKRLLCLSFLLCKMKLKMVVLISWGNLKPGHIRKFSVVWPHGETPTGGHRVPREVKRQRQALRMAVHRGMGQGS